MGSRVARTWRGVAAASVATFAAAVSHSVADGHPAPALGVAIALAFAVPVCVALAGRRLSWGRLAAAVGVSQFAFHALMLLGVGESTGTAYTSMPGMAGHAEQLVATTTGPASMGPHDAGMWLAHGVAALLTVLAIGHGERALRALLALSGWDLVVRILTELPAPVVRRAIPATGRLFVAHEVVRASAVRRRGPPVTA